MKNFIILIPLLAFSTAHSQQRVVLIEQFTNAGCPNCAIYTPQVMTYVNNNTVKTITIAYHTNFPHYDSIYFETKPDMDARDSYYSISSAPYVLVDGNYYQNGTSAFLGVMNSTMSTRAAVAPKYTINMNSGNVNNNMLNASVSFQSLDGANLKDSLQGMVVIIEKNVYKSSYAAGYPGNNSETDYQYTMRKIYPSPGGTMLVNKALNGIDIVNVNWPISKVKSQNELRIVAFVQNKKTKEIYQAALLDPHSTTGIESALVAEEHLGIYPNPSSSGSFYLNSSEGGNIRVLNVNGQTLYSEMISAPGILQINTDHLQPGIYFVQSITDKGTFTQKLILE